MKMLILAVLLTVAQTAPPVPRKTADSSASASHKIQKKPSDNQTPPAPAQPSINADTTPKHDDAGQKQKTDDGRHPIVVGEMPTVTIATSRDWFDWGVWVFSFLLVIVGALQCVVLSRQAVLMRAHADHLEKLASAAKDNAESARLNAEASQQSNKQSEVFFRIQNRPWIAISDGPRLLENRYTDSGQHEFIIGYTIKNYGTAPAFNTVVPFGSTIEDVNNGALVKSKVDEARKSGENIVNLTGDLLLPTATKYNTRHFGQSKRPNKIVIPGCIVYRFLDGTVHHTELSYWIDFSEEPPEFHTAWFQSAD